MSPRRRRRRPTAATGAATRLAELGAAFSPADLLPLPVAALPGWDVEGLGARLFDDASVFRPRAGAPHGAANNAR